MKAPKGDDAFKTGLKLNEIYRNFDKYENIREETNKLIPTDYEQPNSNKIHEIFYSFTENKNIQFVKEQKSLIDSQIIEFGYLLNRLENIKKNTTYYKTAHKPNCSLMAPILLIFMTLSRLELLYYLTEEDPAITIQKIEKDLNVYHRLFESTDSMIPHLVFENVLIFYYEVLDILISDINHFFSLSPSFSYTNLVSKSVQCHIGTEGNDLFVNLKIKKSTRLELILSKLE